MKKTDKNEQRVRILEKLLAEKDEQIKKITDSLIANLSHEIRTPLNAIVGFSNLIISNDIPDKRKEKYYMQVSDNTDKLLRIVDSLMDLAKIQSGQLKLDMENCNLYDLIHNTYQVFNLEKHKMGKKEVALLYCCELKNDEMYVMTDQFRLHQVLNNLIHNALKYTNKGLVEFGVVRHEDILQFYVKDSGKGGLKSDDDFIFKEFVKNEDCVFSGGQGLGIGLTLCKGIIDIMGGKIWHESNIYNGTTFFFTVPYLVAQQDAIESSGEDTNSQLLN